MIAASIPKVALLCVQKQDLEGPSSSWAFVFKLSGVSGEGQLSGLILGTGAGEFWNK